ncbi:MAG: transposase [Anaerolineales bacterium]|nr:transposase [Anaerolineales bacterium]
MALPSPRPRTVSRPSLAASRKRGGQPGNQNARKTGAYSGHHPGPLALVRNQIENLQSDIYAGRITLDQSRQTAAPLLEQLGKESSLTSIRLDIKLIKVLSTRSFMNTPLILLRRGMQSIAVHAWAYIESTFRANGIERDADSFFPVSKKSARNSPASAAFDPLPPGHPSYATNLTDDQWALLAPLIPPDPPLDWLQGQPPLIIAANRWGFSRYQPGSDFNDFTVLLEHDRIASRFPALQASRSASLQTRKRGRPKNRLSPRAMLDAILWKLATGHGWDALPDEFPPMRLCRKYYRRLFLSGRLYTILLALYNHLRIEQGVDLYACYEQGDFTTTPSQSISLAPDIPLTNANCMALLFMQLAREEYTRLERERKMKNPLYPLLPIFKGQSALTTARLPHTPPPPSFEPLEISPIGKRFQKLAYGQKVIQRQVSKRQKKKQPEVRKTDDARHKGYNPPP